MSDTQEQVHLKQEGLQVAAQSQLLRQLLAGCLSLKKGKTACSGTCTSAACNALVLVKVQPA